MAELLSPDQIPPAVRGICETLRSAGFRSWVVGGGIRDALIARHFTDASVTRRPAADWDIATDAVPEQVKRVFRRVIPTGIEHGTVTVVIDHEHFEVTTLRTEAGYRDGRRPDRVQFVSDIADDLGRRDFTVNAIAYDVLADQLIDPFRGLQDLEHRLLRAVGNPADRFAEDGLRILRAARFVATLELELDPATRDAITPALGSYRKVSAERIRDEWLKTLKARRPSRGFRIMQEHGMLAHSAPELTELATPSAGEDAWTYSLRTVDLAPARAELRLAALLHRLEAEAPGTGTARIEARLRQLRFSGQEVAQVRDLVRHHRIDYRSEWSDAQVRRWLRTAGPTLLSDLLELGRALAQAHSLGPDDDQLARIDELGRRSRDQIALGAPLALSDLKIGGTDLIEELGITPGRQIGMLLGALLEKTLDDPELNERTRLLEAARGLASSEPV